MEEYIIAGLGFIVPFWILYNKSNKVVKKGVCVILENSQNIKGIIHLESRGSQTYVKCDIHGLTNGKHGLHVHTSANVSDGCKSTCNHYNPTNKTHGDCNGTNRHKGDFGNIFSDVNLHCETEVIADVTLEEIIGRTFVIHENEDDLGKETNEESLITGNVGKRVACGIIGHL